MLLILLNIKSLSVFTGNAKGQSFRRCFYETTFLQLSAIFTNCDPANWRYRLAWMLKGLPQFFTIDHVFSSLVVWTQPKCNSLNGWLAKLGNIPCGNKYVLFYPCWISDPFESFFFLFGKRKFLPETLKTFSCFLGACLILSETIICLTLG